MTDGTLTILAYHYVRDLTRSAFPRIKGITPEAFEGQLDYITAHFNVVDSAGLVAAAKAGDPGLLPPRAAYLTFDDGLTDHFASVFPILRRRGLHGAFFASAGPTLRRAVAEVHKIQFILAASGDPETLARRILALVAPLRAAYALEADAVYLERHYTPGRFDAPAAAFVKRMLQTALPAAAARQIVAALFRELVTQDEASFAEELYCSTDQLSAMAAADMTIGGHGDTHRRLAGLADAEQAAEIAGTIAMLETIGVPATDWIMCYPHGSHDDGLIARLRACGCAVGLAVETGVARIGKHDRFALPRLDTNHLPHTADATVTSLPTATA
jgi:peptidoglycan/xylan/chitin deacetylase (PgdA/CDA1 family)